MTENEMAFVEAFDSGELKKLMETGSKMDYMNWYKLLTSDVLNTINPIISNVLNMVLDAKVNELWGNLTTDNEVFDMETLKAIERETQLYGKVLVKIDYNRFGEMKLTHFHKGFEIKRDAYGEVFEYKLTRNYTIDEQEYTLIEWFDRDLNYEAIVEEDGQALDDWTHLPEFKYISKASKLKHMRVFMFESTMDASRVLTTLSAIDEHKSEISHIARLGLPIRIDPIDTRVAAMDTKPIDESMLADTIRLQFNGYLKNEYMDAAYQRPEIIQPEIEIEKFQKLVQSNVEDLCRLYGISPISIGYAPFSANASADAINERKDYTTQTINALRGLRKSMLDEISQAIGVKLVFKKVKINKTTDVSYKRLMLDMYKANMISATGAKKEAFTDWNPEDFASENLSMKLQRNLGVGADE